MLTWKRGRQLVFDNLQKHAIPLDTFLELLFVSPLIRVPGTAVFLRAESDGVPHAMLHNLAHNKVLHERIVFLTVHTLDEPWLADDSQATVMPLGHACYQVNLRFGFKDEPDIPRVLALCAPQGLDIHMMETSFFIARQTVIPTLGADMSPWREYLYVALSRNARDAADYYRIPTNRVIELGMQVEI